MDHASWFLANQYKHPGVCTARQEATRIISEWLSHPNIRLVLPARDHWQRLTRVLQESGAVGDLVMDAHLAALALENGATICTADHDFARFKGVDVLYPLQS